MTACGSLPSGRESIPPEAPRPTSAPCVPCAPRTGPGTLPPTPGTDPGTGLREGA